MKNIQLLIVMPVAGILGVLGVLGLLGVLAGCASEPYDPNGGGVGGGSGGHGNPGWVLIWQEEFSGSAGSAIDATRWAFDTGGHGFGNQQLEYNTDRTDNVRLDGQGHLEIVAREESYGGNSYTSGRVKTQGKFVTRYGKIEARIKLPIGQGLWPAFWMLGADFPTVGWPRCGEIDIMEYRGQAPSQVHGAMHGPGYSGATPFHGSYSLGGATFHDGFHTFAVEWTPDRIIWLVDGNSFMSHDVGDLSSGMEWVFDHEFFILLNVAVGGTYVGDPDGSTEFPQTMVVDYVRVYAME